MKLKTVRAVCYALLWLIIALLILMWLANTAVFGFAAIAAVIIFGIFSTVFWRCPSCGKLLGPICKQSFCRYCGQKLDM